MIYTREDIKNVLREGATTVTFTKKDGTVRVMQCTLNEAMIPAEHQPKDSGKTTKMNDTVLPVFDTENQGWRSFAIDAITDVQQAKNMV